MRHFLLLLLWALTPLAWAADASVQAILESQEFKNFYEMRCTEFRSVSQGHQIDSIIGKINASPYKHLMKYFFTLSECKSIFRSDLKVPMISLIVDRINNSAEIPELVLDSFERMRIDPKIFEEGINSRTMRGMTLLDALYNRSISKKHWNDPRYGNAYSNHKDSKMYARYMMDFLCENNGKFNFHKDADVSCHGIERNKIDSNGMNLLDTIYDAYASPKDYSESTATHVKDIAKMMMQNLLCQRDSEFNKFKSNNITCKNLEASLAEVDKKISNEQAIKPEKSKEEKEREKLDLCRTNSFREAFVSKTECQRLERLYPRR